MRIFDRNFWQILLFFILAELVSLVAFLEPHVMVYVFWEICIAVFLIAIVNLRIAVLILLAELFIGSQGHLFYVSLNGMDFSVRMALWLIVLAVWSAKITASMFLYSLEQKQHTSGFPDLINHTNHKTISNGIRAYGFIKQELARSKFNNYFLLLVFFTAFSLLNAYLRHNEIKNIFFDFNAWLYFLLLFPFVYVFKDYRQIKSVFKVFVAGTMWISIKTLILLFIFSHNLGIITSYVYRWVRVSGIGEITMIKVGFYRIFFQSHIFIMVGFLIFLSFFSYRITTKGAVDKRAVFQNFLMMILYLSVVVVSLSRSNWVGLFASLLVFGFFILWQFKRKEVAVISTAFIVSLALSLVVVAGIVKFPYPAPGGSFSTTYLIKERASQVTTEPGVASRWNLLPKLWSAILRHPIMGNGLGTTVTYKSNDPRVLNTHPEGIYTTYAFEWGWLSLWLKLGFFGVLSYMLLLIKIIYEGVKQVKQNVNPELSLALVLGLIALGVTHFFSPYLNHPLGIGYILICARFFDLNHGSKS